MKDLAITFTGGKFSSLVIDGHRIDGVTSLMLSVPTPGSRPTLTMTALVTGALLAGSGEKPDSDATMVSVTKHSEPV